MATCSWEARGSRWPHITFKEKNMWPITYHSKQAPVGLSKRRQPSEPEADSPLEVGPAFHADSIQFAAGSPTRPNRRLQRIASRKAPMSGLQGRGKLGVAAATAGTPDSAAGVDHARYNSQRTYRYIHDTRTRRGMRATTRARPHTHARTNTQTRKQR
jgi:hypothetical protein